MARGIKACYSDIYSRNEFAHSLSKQDLEGLVVEMTGLEKGNSTVGAIVGTFEAIKGFAEFSAGNESLQNSKEDVVEKPPARQNNVEAEEIELGLAYTINLVLPKTDDVAVFNAIFKSLRENLLQK